MSKRDFKDVISSIGCIFVLLLYCIFLFLIIHKSNVRKEENDRKATLVREQYNDSMYKKDMQDRFEDYVRICKNGEDRWGCFEDYFSYAQNLKQNLIEKNSVIEYVLKHEDFFEEDSVSSSGIEWDLNYCAWIYYRLSVSCLYQGDFDEFVENLNDPTSFNNYFECAKLIGLVDTYKFFLKNIVEEDECYYEDIEYNY